MITPLIRKIEKGTLITFQSAMEDFSGLGTSKKFVFSKYVLLNIPDILNDGNKNTIKFDGIETPFLKGLSTDTPHPTGDKTDLAESLQNYLLNFESVLLSQKEYNRDLEVTIAERAFWKWLKEIGAIRYEQLGSYAIEEAESDSYKKVVQYVSELDMENINASHGNTYKEIYIYVPTENGSTPVILFDTLEDQNYPSKTSFAGKSEKILGRESGPNTTDMGLSTDAFYDIDVNSANIIFNTDPFSQYRSDGENLYTTEDAFGLVTNKLIVKNDTITGANLEYRRSNMDGAILCFDKSKYNYFVDNSGTTSFSEYNATSAARSFDFNAVLLYYDIVDDSGNVKATNLFGINFLGDMKSRSGNGAYISRYSKIKPDMMTLTQGNGFGIKLNLKFDINSNQAYPKIETSVNNYNSFSMFLFSDTMQKMANLSNRYEESMIKVAEYQEVISDMSSFISNVPKLADIADQLEKIKENTSGSFSNGIEDQIAKISLQISEILKGNTTVTISNLFDLVTKGGLNHKIIGDSLILENTKEYGNHVLEFDLDMTGSNGSKKSNLLDLKQYTNIFIQKEYLGALPNNHIYIFIQDNLNWKTCQKVEIHLDKNIDWSTIPITIYTDANKRIANAAYSVIIGEGITNENKIEIICTDGEKLKFITNLI